MIKIDLSKCTGCRRCETACSFFHTGKINRNLSRIKVVQLYDTGIDGPVACVQCKERYCLSCPVNALSIGSLGEIKVSPTICILCGKCERECPIGAIEIFNETVFVCDLCGGDPKCVKACTEGAITCVTNDSLSLSEIKKETENMTPDEKRYNYIKNLGTVLRKKWVK